MKKIVIIYAGGTISSLKTKQGYREGNHFIDLMSELQKRNPLALIGIDLVNSYISFNGLSENINYKEWRKIGQKIKRAAQLRPDAIIITHGTDSMEQTARYLQQKYSSYLTNHRIKVILTGANQDINDVKTDAWNNLIFAVESVKKSDNNNDIQIAFHNRLIRADKAIKEPFNGREMNYISIEDPNYQKMILAARWRDDELIKRLTSKYKKLLTEK